MIKIYIKNRLGAGDHANVLPVLNYLTTKYEVYTDITSYNENLYKNTKIQKYDNQSIDIEFKLDFHSGKNIPATILYENLDKFIPNPKDILDKIQYLVPGIILDDAEAIELYNRKKYVNIFPYTTIKQKTIKPEYVKILVKYVESLGYEVFTSYPIYDGGAMNYPWDSLGCSYHPATSYFSREWIKDIVGAVLNICCDGGPFNVSVASRVPTIGLLTIADSSLALFHSNYKIVQSTTKCSPCFKGADYGKGLVTSCYQTKDEDYCGNNFDINQAIDAIDFFLQVKK